MAEPKPTKPTKPKMPSLFGLLRPYRGWIALLSVLTVVASGLGLAVPQVIAHAIDTFAAGRLQIGPTVAALSALTLGGFVVGALQVLVQIYASEKVARDLRSRLADKIAQQTYAQVETLTPASLLTNFTSDVDGIKNFVSTAVASRTGSPRT